MDWAEEKYDVSVPPPRRTSTPRQPSLTTFSSFSGSQKLLIAQVKMVLKVLFLYIPLPMFWALFDQQVTHRRPLWFPRPSRL